MLNKIIVLIMFLVPMPAMAEPSIAGESVPSASFTYVDDKDLLKELGLKSDESGAWCYNAEANAVLITSAARERASCRLELQYKLSEQKIRYDLRVDNLELRIKTLTKQHEDIIIIKDEEIRNLTTAAMKRPNDYTVWWTAGGFLTGVAATLLVALSF